MDLVNITLNKYDNEDKWYYIADVTSSKLSKSERMIVQDFLNSTVEYVKQLNFRG